MHQWRIWKAYGEVRWIGCLTSQSTILRSYICAGGLKKFDLHLHFIFHICLSLGSTRHEWPGAGHGNPGRVVPRKGKELVGARLGKTPSPKRDPSRRFTLGRGRRSFPLVAHCAQAGANVRRSTDIKASLSSAAGHTRPGFSGKRDRAGICNHRGPRHWSRSVPSERSRAGVRCTPDTRADKMIPSV